MADQHVDRATLPKESVPMPQPRLCRAVALAVGMAVGMVVLASGCQLSQLQFVVDDRLSFSAPPARERVTLPTTVRWSIEDFTPTGLDGSRASKQGVFAVFVDAAPMPVGKDIRWLARGDASCKRDPRCPNKDYLAELGVYVTAETSLTLTSLPKAPDGVGDEQHYVNVVLLDGTGHRIGESAWYLPFTFKRRSAP
jgi:hypothetical protein